MATVALRKFTNPDTLKQIGEPHLLTLLMPHRSFFAGRGLILPDGEKLKCGKLKAESASRTGEGENGTSTPDPASGSPHPQPLSHPLGEGGVGGNGHIDCEKLASIFMTPDTDMPRDLADALYLIHEMSTKEAMDKLQAAAEQRQPPLDLNGAEEPADVAVRVWQLDRTLIEQVSAEHELARPKAFISYLMEDGAIPPFALPTEDARREWEKRKDEWFAKKKRGTGLISTRNAKSPNRLSRWTRWAFIGSGSHTRRRTGSGAGGPVSRGGANGGGRAGESRLP